MANQHLPQNLRLPSLWKERFESIRTHKEHLARNGTIIFKFWLNVSKGEQTHRFLSRLPEPEKHWKFSQEDLEEKKLWSQCMKAYEDCLRATSRPWAPWYAGPAGEKPFMRMCVTETIVTNLKRLRLHYPTMSAKNKRNS